VPRLNQHSVIFQAVIGLVESEAFKRYFQLFFEHFQIDFDNTIGFIMDFANAQSKGFLDAYQDHNRLRGNPVSHGYDVLQYLNGCCYHWMQSVRKVASTTDPITA
jgi:hypothetical protein